MERRETIQRKVVLETVQQLGNHPTAEEVYLRLHQDYPSISRATVYRNLKVLSSEGSLVSLVKPGADRYDHRLDKHCHLCCSECGRFEDYESPALRSLSQIIEEESGYALSNNGIVFVGTCPACQKQAAQKKGN
ncbi:MAG: transcriptional repressor [Erysipelotrichaceae bacterium]|jgi:Fe2+ or Zn2+ uptake regulation protein|nr:transcriptional repressor [Erysipelotrichaceae bacterium]